MKNLRSSASALLLVALLFFMTGCAPSAAGSVNFMDKVEAADWPDVRQEMNGEFQESVSGFSWDLFVRSLDEEGNILVSPASVYLALSMTMNGAKGDTLEAMGEAMHTGSLGMEIINEESRNWISLIREETEKTVTTVANSIWVREAYNVSMDFLQTNADYFDAGAMGLDFSDANAPDVINQWVKDNTNGAIEKIVDDIDKDSMMFLVNAIYFKSQWKEPFCGEYSVEGAFNGPEGLLDVIYMRRTDEMEYLDWNGYKGIVLPYESQGYEFFAILPEEGTAVRTELEEAGPQFLGEILQQKETQKVTLTIPKFEMRYEKVLNNVLKNMGMTVAFSGQADFSGMNQDGISDLFIGEVLHKTFMRVDEEGTEAAAVTSVDMRLTSMPEAGIPLTFDRPFLFGIWNSQTQTPLFLGWMEAPTLE